MAEKLKIKFLTAIWGVRYIEEFARVSLPSYLALGNIPYVAAETNLEIVIMTSRNSAHKFSEIPIFDRLRALCPIRYIFIDDLITTGNYGVTLTLAYARGIVDSGTEQTNTNFVFMNSDFILAEGSLRTLVGKLRDGERCIMAPSLRAVSELVLPELIEAVDKTSETLSKPPREMVRLALNNLHPTVIGKTITQDFITCANHNQLYWQVDRSTLLGRYHLIFMLAIKPEVPLRPINSYCDYGFVPELVPSGKFSILGDSDDFFMLELQPAAQERQLIQCGTSTPEEIADELGRWTTVEHRRFAEVDVVFRTGELPANLAEHRKLTANYITNLHRIMPNPPCPHVDHFYWVSGMQSWASLKYAGETAPGALPPEVAVSNLTLFTPALASGSALPETPHPQAPSPVAKLPLKKRLVQLYIELVNYFRVLAGTIPNVPLWHHLWLDARLIRKWMAARTQLPHQRNLLICEANEPLSVSLPKLVPFELSVDPDDFAARPNELHSHGAPAAELYDNVFLHIRRANVRETRRILELAEVRLAPDGMIAIYISHPNAEVDSSNFSFELAHYVDLILPTDWIGYRVQARFAGGLTKRRLRQMESFLFRYLMPSTTRWPLLVAAVMSWPVVATFTALNNVRLRNRSRKCPRYCSSALISLTKLPQSSTSKY